MTFSELVLKCVPVAIIGGLAYFVFKSNRRQQIAVVLAWAFPGAGHWWLGRKDRAKYFAGFLVSTFLFGLILGDFLNVSPFDRHPIWGLAQLPGGLMTLGAWLGTMSLKVTEQNDYYLIGCLYCGSACLLNLLAMCDVWDLAGEPITDEKSAPRVPSTEEQA